MSRAAAGSAHEADLALEAQQEADRVAAEQEAERAAEQARIQADIDEAERIAFEEAAEANRLEQENAAAAVQSPQPPVDNDHVAPGATLFTNEEISNAD